MPKEKHDIMLSLEDIEFYQAIKDYPSVMVFGAGVNGRREYHNCRGVKKDVSCYLVSSRSAKTGSVLDGIPVRQIDDVSPSEKQESLVIVGRSYENHQETVRLLREHGFCHIIPGNGQFTAELSEEQAAELRNVFGSDLLLHIPSLEREKACSLKIYAVTSAANFHKANGSWHSKYIEYIQAGAALTERRICALTDDTGENVSQYNRYLNESTAGYWIAKNDVWHQYVGLYQYSRGMDLSDRQLEWIVEHDMDVVLKTPEVHMYNVLSFSGGGVYEAICKYAPDYAEAARYYFLENRFFIQGNIQITKREIFREYYEWAFYMLKGMGEMYPDAIAKMERYFGYIMENLMHIWYIKNAGRFRFAFAPWRQLYE